MLIDIRNIINSLNLFRTPDVWSTLVLCLYNSWIPRPKASFYWMTIWTKQTTFQNHSRLSSTSQNCNRDRSLAVIVINPSIIEWNFEQQKLSKKESSTHLTIRKLNSLHMLRLFSLIITLRQEQSFSFFRLTYKMIAKKSAYSHIIIQYL